MINFQARVLVFLAAMMSLCSPLQAQDLSALTDWVGRVSLSSVSSGMLAKVNVSPGDQVAKGDILMQLDQRGIESELAASRARAKAAGLLNDEAKRELDRALELYERTLLSDHERKLAEIDAAKAEAELRQAESALTQARLQSEFSRIRSPFDGIVLAVHVQPGQAVNNRLEAMPLVTVAAMPMMKAVTRIDERMLARLKPGDGVQIGIRGAWREGKVSYLGFDPEGQAGGSAQYRLEVVFTPSDRIGLRAGEQAVVRLPDE